MQVMEAQRAQLAQAQVHHVEAQAQRIAPLTPRAVLGTAGHQPRPVSPPPAWYLDQHGVRRWWDGTNWTEHTQDRW